VPRFSWHTRAAQPVPHSARLEAAARLQARRPEIEEAVLARVLAVPEPTEIPDPDHFKGICAATSAALDYSIAAIEHGDDRSPPMPTILLTQVRLAARKGEGVDIVLRRCLAGNTVFSDFLTEEAADTTLQLLRAQAAIFERLVDVVIDEYTSDGALSPVS
jgi:hypothetical protein